MKIYGVSITVLLVSLSISGMEEGARERNLPRTPKKSQLLHSYDSDIVAAITDRIKRLQKGDEVYIDSYMITYEPLVKELVLAHKHGVIIEIIVDSESVLQEKGILLTLQRAGIDVFVVHLTSGVQQDNKLATHVLMHNKNVLVRYFNAEENRLKTLCFVGSANLTNLASCQNVESSLMIVDKQATYDALKRFHDKMKIYAEPFDADKDYQAAQKRPLQEFGTYLTKIKKTFTDYTTHEFAVATSDCFDEVATLLSQLQDMGDGDRISLRMYALRDRRLITALSRFLERDGFVKIYTDISNKREEDFQELISKGALVEFVDLSSAHQKAKFHEKTVLFERKNQGDILAIGTGNLVFGTGDQLTRQLNTTIYTQNPDLIAQFKQTSPSKKLPLKRALGEAESVRPSAMRKLTFEEEALAEVKQEVASEIEPEPLEVLKKQAQEPEEAIILQRQQVLKNKPKKASKPKGKSEKAKSSGTLPKGQTMLESFFKKKE